MRGAILSARIVTRTVICFFQGFAARPIVHAVPHQHGLYIGRTKP